MRQEIVAEGLARLSGQQTWQMVNTNDAQHGLAPDLDWYPVPDFVIKGYRRSLADL